MQPKWTLNTSITHIYCLLQALHCPSKNFTDSNISYISYTTLVVVWQIFIECLQVHTMLVQQMRTFDIRALLDIAIFVCIEPQVGHAGRP